VNEKELGINISQLAKSFKLRKPEVQMLLCQERFLARLGSIPEGRAFIWKGGSLIVRLYRTVAIPRYTIDVDLTVGGISSDSVRGVLEKAMRIDLGDGFVFTGITAHSMERDTPYGGERFELDWRFFSKGSSRKLRVDACAGDVVDPTTIGSSEVFLLPFGSENIELKVYPKAFVIAEKFETILRFRTGNTRCKDFIDIWLLIQSDIDRITLQNAIRLCLSNRKTPFSLSITAEIFLDRFFQERLENYRKRHFSHLGVPQMKQVMDDILSLIRSLDL